MAISTISSAGLAAGAVDSTQLASGAAVTNIGSGGITSTQLATAVQPVGVGQTWQDLTASRAYGTTYTNSSGRPIMVAISILNSGAVTSSVITVSGVNILNAGTQANRRTAYSFIVPNGATYLISGNESLSLWAELR